ncbi:hypothetical protein [Azohydromonas lata]|uniref:Uncharacterized protein n=1 Tax=Azohydromonas lata TaxID=45677 RepID=A0ABU5IRG0_9BURK|nr:hypothetical protein [Azohydromonas lata]MDZ5461483.1 hypothetical protein [Azohydromonas lata]
MKALPSLIAALALALGGAAFAHDDATLDKMKAANGGQLRAAGAQHYELVVAPPGSKGEALPVAVYVTDHAGAKVPVAGASGNVTVLSGGQKATIALQPAGDNLLKGSGAYVPGHDLKAIVSVTLPGQPAGQARFEPFGGGGHSH